MGSRWTRELMRGNASWPSNTMAKTLRRDGMDGSLGGKARLPRHGRHGSQTEGETTMTKRVWHRTNWTGNRPVLQAEGSDRSVLKARLKVAIRTYRYSNPRRKND